MLWEKLLGAKSKLVPQFVGRATTKTTTSATNLTISLTSLTGGTRSTAKTGDVVILAASLMVSADRTFTASGYTKLADLYANGTYDTNLGVFYKVLTADDTSANVAWTTSTAPGVAAVYVWSGIDNTTPIDATTTTATVTNSGSPDAPSITTVTDGAIVIAVGANAANTNLSTLTTPSGMSNTVADNAVVLDGSFNVIAYTGLALSSVAVATAGAYNPAPFGGGSTTTSYSNASVTVALRPE